MKKIYIKHNSFFGLRMRNKKNIKNFISGIKLILDDDNNCKNLSLNFLRILKLVKKDLFKKNFEKKPKFKLTPNVIQEIETLNVDQIPKYLVHRYRYEIYPQLRIFDDFPPLLQIEPTSICNYRCVFCYQFDNKKRICNCILKLVQFEGVVENHQIFLTVDKFHNDIYAPGILVFDLHLVFQFLE
jgi:hypothetical protein